MATILLLIMCLLIPIGNTTTVHAEMTDEEEQMDAQQLPDFIALWDFSDPAGTEAKFRELLPQAEASGDRLYHIELLTQVARTEGLQGKFKEAHRTLDHVASMLTSGDEAEMLKGRLRYLLERGRVYNSDNMKQEAIPLFLEAWELATSTSFDGLAIDAAHMLGIATEGQDSLDWNLKALSKAELSDDPKAANWKGALYNNIGWTYMERHEPEKALEIFIQGVEFRQANEHPEQTRMVAHWTVARALRELGRHAEALAKLQYVADNFPGHSEDPFWHEELGENRLATGGLEAARPHFEAAVPLLKAQGWIGEHYPGRIERLDQMLAQGLPLLEIGSRAPQFRLPIQDGSEVSLEELLATGPVVLAFYPKDHTGGCTLELAEYSKRRAEFDALGARVLGISGDDVDSHASFCEAQSYTIDLLADVGNEVRAAYGAQNAEGRPGRVSYVINRDGYIVGFCASSSDMQAHAAETLAILERISGEKQ